MAPLNSEKVNEDERLEEAEDCADSLKELSAVYLARTDLVCRKRNSVSHLKLWTTNHLSSNYDRFNDKDINENEKNLSPEKENKQCEKCLQQKTADMTVYLKQKQHAVVTSTSVRTVLFEMSPDWFKKFISEPEYVMTETKTADSSEIHRHADSLFSTSSGFNNYRGLLNLCIILLVTVSILLQGLSILTTALEQPVEITDYVSFEQALSNARLFLENIIKYGILIDPIRWVTAFLNQPYSVDNLLLILGANVFILIIYGTEKALVKDMFSEKMALIIQSVTLISLITIPATVTLLIEPNPLLSTVILGMYTVLFLKLVSYASVNKWCRQTQSPRRTRLRRTKSVSVSEGAMANGKEETMLVHYPENLNMNDLYYFMFAPTLCYELNFPRSLRIRKRFLLKRIIEMLFVIQLIAACIQQWVLPLVHNSMKPLADMDPARCIERLLKLAVPNHFIWLMFFYWFFHSTLNVIAELMKFGDREFYKDWWNSDTVSQFWSSWNIPVHRWASRHLYKPLVRRGYSKLNGSVAVFCLSAFFHEYLVSIPLHMFKLWAFMGMLGQVPLAVIQTKYVHGKYGNMVVWLSLILGQPVAILAYYHDFYINAYTAAMSGNQTLAL